MGTSTMEDGDAKLAVEVGVEAMLAVGYCEGDVARVEMANDAWSLPGQWLGLGIR